MTDSTHLLVYEDEQVSSKYSSYASYIMTDSPAGLSDLLVSPLSTRWWWRGARSPSWSSSAASPVPRRWATPPYSDSRCGDQLQTLSSSLFRYRTKKSTYSTIAIQSLSWQTQSSKYRIRKDNSVNWFQFLHHFRRSFYELYFYIQQNCTTHNTNRWKLTL